MSHDKTSDHEEFIVSCFRDLLRARRRRHVRWCLGIVAIAALLSCCDLLIRLA